MLNEVKQLVREGKVVYDRTLSPEKIHRLHEQLEGR